MQCGAYEDSTLVYTADLIRVKQRHVHFEYGRFSYLGAEPPALDGISLEIPVHSMIGLVGTTGSGKTTLVDVIVGLLRPESGQIIVDDEPITDEN